MAKTLTVGATVVTLHDDMFWSDEHSWSVVEQVQERALTGALVVNAGTKQTGRPITLQPPDDNSAWMIGSVLTQLKAWAQTPLLEMTLVMGGVTRTVMYRHDAGALDASLVVGYSDPDENDFYSITLRLMDVTP